MPVRKEAPFIGDQKREGDHHRSLVRIAARLLYVKAYEEQGVNELALLAYRIQSIVFWQHTLCLLSFAVCAIITFGVLLIWLAASMSSVDPDFIAFITIFAPFAAVMFGTIFYWRHFQYGFKLDGGPIPKAHPAIYGDADKATVETLEKLFTYLAMRTSPQAYYDRKFFLGSLRGLLLSSEASGRAIVLPPYGFWFSHEIKIEAEPEVIIAALKATPNTGGRPVEIDYKAIALLLIEHPKLKNIEPGRHGDETQVMNLIRDTRAEQQPDIRVPEGTKLREFTREIMAAIKNNRAKQK
jgi:hypothetical protein